MIPAGQNGQNALIHGIYQAIYVVDAAGNESGQIPFQ